MQTGKWKIMITGCFVAALFLVSLNTIAQTHKLPDGSIVYSDGTRKLPNGTVIYKSGSHIDNRGANVVLPNSNIRYPNGNGSFANGRRIPPGQAKKMYGGSARNYAPGQQKNWKTSDEGERNDDDHDDKGKHGKGHKD